MRWAVVGLIGLGVVAAACAALLVASMGTGKVATTEVDIIVAAKAIAPFTRLEADDLTTKRLQKREAPVGHFTNPVQVVGRSSLKHLMEGQALTEDCFGDQDAAARLAQMIPPDKVGANITLADASSIENLLYPGCYVDVLWTSNPTEDREPPTTRTLFNNIKVIAIGQQSLASPRMAETPAAARHPRPEDRKVTLELTPNQAKSLQVAQAGGSISLTLRNPGTQLGPDGGSVSLNNLLGRSGVPQPTSAPVTFDDPPAWEMEVIRGGKREKQELPMPGP